MPLVLPQFFSSSCDSTDNDGGQQLVGLNVQTPALSPTTSSIGTAKASRPLQQQSIHGDLHTEAETHVDVAWYALPYFHIVSCRSSVYTFTRA
jgi:hypothetical protein